MSCEAALHPPSLAEETQLEYAAYRKQLTSLSSFNSAGSKGVRQEDKTILLDALHQLGKRILDSASSFRVGKCLIERGPAVVDLMILLVTNQLI